MSTCNRIPVSFDKTQIAYLKAKSVRGRPYAERISIALAFRLLDSTDPMFDRFSVLDEIDYLEGIKGASRTKPESQFTKPPLFPFWHKHFCSVSHLIKNVGIRWNLSGGGNKDLDKIILKVERQFGEDADAWPDHLAHQLVVNGFKQRAERGLTGDWLIYAKHEEQNYYLDLATHEEGRDEKASMLFEKLRNGSSVDFPFLFESLKTEPCNPVDRAYDSTTK